MSWIYLCVAGMLEVLWAVGLKFTDGFTRPIPSILTAVTAIASMVLLALAVRSIPIGSAYAIWVGIGALGAAIAGIVWFGEPATPLRGFFLVLLTIAIAGLKVTSGPS